MNIIFDKHGREYQISIIETVIGQNFVLRYRDTRIRGQHIGYANCPGKNTDKVFLADIHIHNDAWVVYPRTGVLKWLKRARPVQQNFQKLGLGTGLLQFALIILKARGFKRVVGRLKDHDLLVNPNLPKWYSAMGFVVADGAISKEL